VARPAAFAVSSSYGSSSYGKPSSSCSSPYSPQIPQNSKAPSSNSKQPFRPPFLQGGNTSQGLNASFGRKSGKAGMFKASGTNKAHQDDAAEFRGHYEHKLEMYKIFNRVSALCIIMLVMQRLCYRDMPVD
jgi:hypothetical protein